MNIKQISTIRILMIGAAFVIAITAALLVRQASSASTSTPAPASAASPRQGSPNAEYKQMIRVWVHNDGIYPSVVYATPGKIVLRAENETRSDVSLIVERVLPGQANAQLTRLTTQSQAKRVFEERSLGAGEYVFYDEARPEYKGTLIVEAQKQ